MEAYITSVIFMITTYKHVAAMVQVLILQMHQKKHSHVHYFYQGRYRIRREAVECSLLAVHFVLDRPH